MIFRGNQESYKEGKMEGLKLMLLGNFAYWSGFFVIFYLYNPATPMAILMGLGGVLVGFGFAHFWHSATTVRPPKPTSAELG